MPRCKPGGSEAGSALPTFRHDTRLADEKMDTLWSSRKPHSPGFPQLLFNLPANGGSERTGVIVSSTLAGRTRDSHRTKCRTSTKGRPHE